MDENKFKAIVEEVVNKAVEPIRKQLEDPDTGLVAINRRLDDPDTGLKRLNNRMDANTAAVMELEKTVKGYGDMYKINDSNIRKMEKRLETLEEDVGVKVPPELQLVPQ